MQNRLGSASLMLDADLMFRPAGELAGLVRRGDISARELVETSVRRIEALDPQHGAFIDIDGERAIEHAAGVGTDDPRPFAGVPIAIKNNRAILGWRLTHACDLMRDFIASDDHNVVRRLKEAGFLIVGRTTSPPGPAGGRVSSSSARRTSPSRGSCRSASRGTSRAATPGTPRARRA